VRAAATARRRDPLDLDAAGWTVSVRAIEQGLLHDGLTHDGALRSAVESGVAFEQWDVGVARAAWLGPWPPTEPVLRATLARIASRNGDGPWVVPWPGDQDDGLPGTEPPSVVATLWLARALALAGQPDEAHERIEAVAALGGAVGLLPESFDPRTGLALGNRPSAEAHVAFLEAVLTQGRRA